MDISKIIKQGVIFVTVNANAKITQPKPFDTYFHE